MSAYGDGRPPESFRTVREQLRFWPYTIHQIDDTLDVSLIEGRGRQLLFQAMNSHNLTAFVGAGVSAAYGRLGWSDWQREQFSVVQISSDAFEGLAMRSIALTEALIEVVDPGETDRHPAPSDLREHVVGRDAVPRHHRYNAWRWLRFRKRQVDAAWRQVKRLIQTFRRAEHETGSFPGGDAFPVKFQIVEQLHEELRRHVRIFLAPRDKDEAFDVTRDRCWPGSRIDDESAAPQDALAALRAAIDGRMPPELERLTREFDDALDAYHAAYSRPQARMSAEQLAKTLLVDERAHAMITLRGGLEPDGRPSSFPTRTLRRVTALETRLGIYDAEALKRDIDGIREKAERYRILSAFRFETLSAVRDDLERRPHVELTRWRDLMDFVTKRLAEYHGEVASAAGDERRYLTPTSRFLLGTYLILHEDPWSLATGADGAVGEDSVLFDAPRKGDFTSRRSIIADRFDPLAKTVRSLGINRYITTNYDMEIERFFQDIGYRKFPPRQVMPRETDEGPDRDEFRSDPIGGVLLDQSFVRESASDLTAFALGGEGTDASVFHLHGRAALDDDLVITERDYMDLYLKEDDHRETVDEGITMAFSSAPLLFLGLGLEEADLLRPLRQFMSNRDRTIGYHAVALLPAEKPIEARTKFAASCFLRYGVHTIFYGSGRMEPEHPGGERRTIGIDWLSRMVALLGALGKEVKKLRDGRRDPAPAVLARLARAVDVLGDDIDGIDEESSVSALMVLFGHVVSLPMDENAAEARAEALASFVEPIRSGALKLHHCTFTPVRPGVEIGHTRHYTRGTEIEGKPYVGFATRLTSEALRIVLALHATDPGPDKGVQRELAALDQMRGGLFGALLTGSLNAQLSGLQKEWRAWWQNWQQSPPHRLPRFQRLPHPPGGGDVHPARYVRHRVDSIITNIERMERTSCDAFPVEKQGERWVVKEEFRTEVRAYDMFIAAVGCRFDKAPQPADRRLMITIAALRGFGKGTLLTAMSSRLGLSLYAQAAWRPPAESAAPRPFILAGAFINLSFSTEVASTYDMLIEALREVVACLSAALAELRDDVSAEEVRKRLARSLDPGRAPEDRPYDLRAPDGAAREAADRIDTDLDHESRIRSIEHLFAAFATLSQKAAERDAAFGRARFLLYLGGVELIYQAGGRPKNAEIAQLLGRLTGKDFDAVPVDVIIVGSERGLGWPFDQVLGEGGRAFRQHRLDRGRLHGAAEEQVIDRMSKGRIRIDDEEGGQDRPASDEHRVPVNHVHFARPVSPKSLLVANLPVLATALYIADPPRGPRDDGGSEARARFDKEIGEPFREAVQKGRRASDERMAEIWRGRVLPAPEELDEARRLVWEHVERDMTERLARHVAECGLIDSPALPLTEILERWAQAGDGRQGEKWRLVRHRLGYNRFVQTILLAAAEQVVIQAPSGTDGPGEADEFILFVVDQVRNVGEARREELVLRMVIDRYRRIHRIGDPDLDQELHQLILRHLGVVGAPIGTAVLVRLPEIRDYFTRVGAENEISRRRFIGRALTVLCYRGLVFRISPHPRLVDLAQTVGQDDPHWPAEREFRYALHRSVQRYALSKLGVGNVDPVRLNTFAPRLYASMGSIGTGLSRDSQLFLRALLIGLSQYPDIPHGDVSLRPWLFTTRTTNVRVQALRAALSLARSTLSVATLSRFGDDRPETEEQRKLGLLQTYKIRLRWIIRMSWELVEETEIEAANLSAKSELRHLNALYRDEIVWLYNEIGVVSLAQGNLIEALGFLRQAAEFNEDIEGRPRFGPCSAYIDLNHAVVQFERGRIPSARARLERIRGEPADTSLLSLLAEGYLCVIDHVTGKTQGLGERFDRVTAELQTLDETRATAIMLMHKARFVASQKRDATKDLELAKALAETGGHEDVRHHVEVARLILHFRSTTEADAPSGEKRGALRQLGEIERYGRRMGIWSLQVDSLRLRAQILLATGETATAGSLIVRAMAISKRNGMALRLNGALTIYARILQERGDEAGARTHAQISLEMAKATGYAMQTFAAQQVLQGVRGG